MFRKTQLEIDQIKEKLSNGESSFKNGSAMVEVSLSDLNKLLELAYFHEKESERTQSDFIKKTKVLQKSFELLDDIESERAKYFYALDKILELNETAHCLEDAFEIARSAMETQK